MLDCVPVDGQWGPAACVSPELVQTVDQPGINLSALRPQADAVRRLGVRISVSQSCTIDEPTPVVRLRRTCVASGCFVYKPAVCSTDRASCTYHFAVRPAGAPGAVRLESVSFDAVSASRRAEVEAEVFATGSVRGGQVRIAFTRLAPKVRP